jgi:two-component system response regulator NreC
MEEERPLKIVLADDHQVVRRGLRLLLEAEPGLSVVRESGTLFETVRDTRAHRPDVLVLDLNFGDESSLGEIPKIREVSPETAIVILTMQREPGYARAALQAGAKGFVLKDAAGEDLVAAVRAAAEGRVYLDPEMGGALAAAPPEPDGPPDGLTTREAEVLRLLALGHTNAEIGEQLFLSVRTVETHRAHIQQKTSRTTRAELVRYALDHGMLDGDG